MSDEKLDDEGNLIKEDEGKEVNDELGKKFDDMLESLKGVQNAGEATNVKVESLLNEAIEKGKQDVKENISDEDLQQMSPNEVIEMITESVNKQVGGKIQELETTIMTLTIKKEVEDCRNDYEDFDTLREEVKKTAIENPSISIRKAYILVKGERGEPVVKKGTKPKEPKKEKNEDGTKKKLIRTFFGEKPNISASATKDKAPASIREAAEKAFEDINTE